MPEQNALVLLSALHNTFNHGLPTKEKFSYGQFFWIGAGDSALMKVANALKGECISRESIPSVLAQEILFELCVDSYGKNSQEGDHLDTLQSEALKQIVSQWKGTVAAHLLLDDLIKGLDDEIYVENIRYSTDANSMMSARVLPHENQFVKSMIDAIDSRTPKSWDVCLISRKPRGKKLPLFQLSPKTIVIPPADLNEFAESDGRSTWLKCIPWLKVADEEQADDNPMIRFHDPLPFLNNSQLEKLLDLLKDIKNESSCKCKQAVQRFISDIEAHRDISGPGESIMRAEACILAALLLRDALSMHLPIRRIDDRLYVTMNGTPIAFLSEDKIIELHNPSSYLNDPEFNFEALYSQVMPLLEQKACYEHVYEMLQNKLSLTFTDHKGRRIDSPAVATLKKYLHDNGWKRHEAMISAVLKLNNGQDDDELTGEILSCFAYRFVPPLDKTLDFFSQKIVCFKAYSTSSDSDNGLYAGSRIRNSWYKFTSSDGSECQVYLPFGRLGAYYLLKEINMKETTNAIDIVIEQNESRIEFSVRRKVDNTTYELRQAYGREDTYFLDGIDNAPAVGVWPDIRYYNGSLDTWKDFYIYAYFPNLQNRYEATVFYPPKYTEAYPQYSELIDNPLLPNTHRFSMGEERWLIRQCDRFPLYLELSYNNSTVGVIPCFAHSMHKRRDLHAILSIDFGMSSTVGSFCIVERNSAATWDGLQPAGFVARSTGLKIGADLNTPQKAASGIVWQFNEQLGILSSSNHFLSELLNTVSINDNQSGAVFSMIRRFSSAKAEDTKPFYAGNIPYVGQSNLPEYDAHTASGLKMPIELSIPAMANMALFLKEILELYWFHCYQEGISSIELRFAYPLAMSMQRRDNLYQTVKSICTDLSDKTGIELTKLCVSNESSAVQTYCNKNSQLKGILERDILVTVDIGGGTTDFSILGSSIQSKATDIGHYYSTELAGNRMFAHSLFNSKNDKISEQREQIINAFPSLASQVRDNKQLFTTLIDYMMRINHKGLLQMITDTRSPMHHVLVFELCLLEWFANLLCKEVLKSFPQNNKPGVAVWLAGNGSRFYQLLDSNTKDNIRAVSSIESMSPQVFSSLEQKMEVAKGLTLMTDGMDELYPNAIQNPPADYESGSKKADGKGVDSQAIWTDFLNFLEKYHNCFKDFSVISPIMDSKEKKQKLKNEFTKECVSLSSLVAYFPMLCNIMNIAQTKGGDTNSATK